MTQHVKELIPLYHDGELDLKQSRIVKQHLGTCSECRREFQSLQNLSLLLQKNPVPKSSLAPERFTANINLRLARRKKEFSRKTVFELLWNMIPWGLLGGWIFMQVLMLVVTLVSLLLLSPLGSPANLADFAPGPGSFWNFLLTSILSKAGMQFDLSELFNVLGFTGWMVFFNLIIPLVFIVLYLSWFAGWFIRKRSAQTAIS